MRPRFLPLLLVFAAAAGCGSAGASTGTHGGVRDVSLQLDWYPNPDHTGLYTAIDRGFFAREGLRVTPHQPMMMIAITVVAFMIWNALSADSWMPLTFCP